MGWINCTANPADKVILYSGFEGNDQIIISLQQGIIELDFVNTQDEIYSTGGSVLPYNTWTHLAIKFDNFLKVFVNGVKV